LSGVPDAAATILLCTDDPGLRLLLRLAIEPHGHRVIDAGDGDAGIILFQSTSPDLAIVDLRLPDRSGIEVVRVMRELAQRDRAPILMAIGSSRVTDRLAAEDAGVDAFICKPFSITWLIGEIERLLPGVEPEDVTLPLRRLV
jgi:two-component system chemotaxis response regulator CheY